MLSKPAGAARGHLEGTTVHGGSGKRAAGR
jgi:hypothetical protein